MNQYYYILFCSLVYKLSHCITHIVLDQSVIDLQLVIANFSRTLYNYYVFDCKSLKNMIKYIIQDRFIQFVLKCAVLNCIIQSDRYFLSTQIPKNKKSIINRFLFKKQILKLKTLNNVKALYNTVFSKRIGFFFFLIYI